MDDPSHHPIVIRTASPDWLTALARAYRSKTPVELIDDASIGVNPLNDTLLGMGRKAGLSAREWSAVAVALGVGGLGAGLLIMAVLDPEPYSKIVFALGTGAFLAASGGHAGGREAWPCTSSNTRAFFSSRAPFSSCRGSGSPCRGMRSRRGP